MAIHDNFVALAKRLIDKHGRSVSIRSETYVASTSQPWKKSAGSSSTTDYKTKAAFLDNDQRYLLLALPGRPDQPTTVQMELDRLVLIAADSIPIEITIKDTIVDGSKVWKITQAKLIQPGPTPVVWMLRVAN